MLPDPSEALVPLGPLAVALAPVPDALLAVPLSASWVVADEPPVPTVDADTPLPAVALPPVPAVLLLAPALEPLVSPEVPVVVVLSALRTPVPPSACRPAAKPLLSVVLSAPVFAAWAAMVVPNANVPAIRLAVNPLVNSLVNPLVILIFLLMFLQFVSGAVVAGTGGSSAIAAAAIGTCTRAS